MWTFSGSITATHAPTFFHFSMISSNLIGFLFGDMSVVERVLSVIVLMSESVGDFTVVVVSVINVNFLSIDF